MSLAFPSNPALNDTYTYNTKTWVWNGSAWDLQSTGAINGIPIGNVSASTGNFTILSGANITATGNVTGGNIITAGIVTATGNVTGGNLTTAGIVTATGNVRGGNLTTAGNVTGGNLTTAGIVTATGNVTGGNLVTAGIVTATGNVRGGNLTTAGSISATGNITGNTYFGNGAFNSFQYDDISSSTNGTKGTFALRYNQANLSVTDPFALDVAVNGMAQPTFIWNSDVIWQTFALGTFKGYTIISSGNITFTTPPLPNSDVVIKTSSGQAVSNTKRYPFLPADIMLGT